MKRKKEEESGNEKQRWGWQIRQRMDLREAALFKRQWRGPCWGSYEGQIHSDGNWLLCVLTTLEFKRLSKHYARESHNNDQRSNKRHEVRETGSEGETRKKSQEGRDRVEKRNRKKKINTLLYAALRMCPLAAPDSLSKDFNSQQTNCPNLSTDPYW